MTFIDQQTAAAWHREQLAGASHARLVRALRRQRRARQRSQRCDSDVERALQGGSALPW